MNLIQLFVPVACICWIWIYWAGWESSKYQYFAESAGYYFSLLFNHLHLVIRL